jgi:5-amino-6-(5-phospho-D-ribitylamino)uracil phosphatase
MAIRLIAIDLDGTLLDATKQVSEPTRDILRRAREEARAEIVLASARPPRTVQPFYDLLGLQTPMINYNGALVYHPSTRRVALHRPIGARAARRAVQIARTVYPEVRVSVEVLDRWYTDQEDETYLTETALLCNPDIVAPIDTWLRGAVTKLLLLGRTKGLARVGEAIGSELSDELRIMQTEDHLLQIMHVMVSKARALQAVAAELGVHRDHVMAIGDNANDVGMLRWANVGVAMGNANPHAIAAADYVTDHHDADGVANAVRRIVLEGRAPGKRIRPPEGA